MSEKEAGCEDRAIAFDGVVERAVGAVLLNPEGRELDPEKRTSSPLQEDTAPNGSANASATAKNAVAEISLGMGVTVSPDAQSPLKQRSLESSRAK